MFLLDTNVVSELRKSEAGKANEGVFTWAHEIPSAFMFLSVISLHEIEHGVLLAERSDPPKGAILRDWLEAGVKKAFSDRIVVVDSLVAVRSAGLHLPDPAPFRDALIGASALVHGMAVVTRNVADFERFEGLALVNPWR